jgi:hypothetical protein
LTKFGKILVFLADLVNIFSLRGIAAQKAGRSGRLLAGLTSPGQCRYHRDIGTALSD